MDIAFITLTATCTAPIFDYLRVVSYRHAASKNFYKDEFNGGSLFSHINHYVKEKARKLSSEPAPLQATHQPSAATDRWPITNSFLANCSSLSKLPRLAALYLSTSTAGLSLICFLLLLFLFLLVLIFSLRPIHRRRPFTPSPPPSSTSTAPISSKEWNSALLSNYTNMRTFLTDEFTRLSHDLTENITTKTSELDTKFARLRAANDETLTTNYRTLSATTSIALADRYEELKKSLTNDIKKGVHHAIVHTLGRQRTSPSPALSPGSGGLLSPAMILRGIPAEKMRRLVVESEGKHPEPKPEPEPEGEGKLAEPVPQPEPEPELEPEKVPLPKGSEPEPEPEQEPEDSPDDELHYLE